MTTIIALGSTIRIASSCLSSGYHAVERPGSGSCTPTEVSMEMVAAAAWCTAETVLRHKHVEKTLKNHAVTF